MANDENEAANKARRVARTVARMEAMEPYAIAMIRFATGQGTKRDLAAARLAAAEKEVDLWGR